MTARGGRRFGATLLLVTLASCEPPRPTAPSAVAQSFAPLNELLDCGQPGYRRPAAGDGVRLPADHGAHSGFCTELWSLGGELRAQDQDFVFRFVLWRASLWPQPATDSDAPGEDWRAREVYLGELRVQALDGSGSHSAERLSRAAVGLAGSGGTPPAVWVENWRLVFARGGDEGDNDALLFDADADADAGFGLRLRLQPLKPPVSSPSPGLQAYMLSRLRASGELHIAGVTRAVRGEAWLDHGWGGLPQAATAGDAKLSLARFALRLDDGREISLNARSRRDRATPPQVDGVLIEADGHSRRLRRRDVELSPQPQAQAWRLRLPGEAVELDLEVPQQAVTAAPGEVYRSLPLRVRGSVAGRGRVELIGYRQETEPRRATSD